MNREEFLAALHAELSDLSAEERDEALKFYSEFLDEAGPEQEQSVLEELGSPQKVAKIIRTNLGLAGIAEVQAGAASTSFSDSEGEPLPETEAAPNTAPTDDANDALSAPDTKAEAASTSPVSQNEPANGPQLTLDGPDWSAKNNQAPSPASESSGCESGPLHSAAADTAGTPSPASDPYTNGPAYTQTPTYSAGHPYDVHQDVSRRQPKSSNTWLWVVILALTCPIWLSLLGGIIGLILGLLGGIIGIGAGGIAAIASGAFSLLSALFNLFSPLDALVEFGLGLAGIAIGCLMVSLCAWILGKLLPACCRFVKRFFNGLLGKAGR